MSKIKCKDTKIKVSPYDLSAVNTGKFKKAGNLLMINIDSKTMEATKQAMKTKTHRSFHGMFWGLHGLAINVDLSLGSWS